MSTTRRTFLSAAAAAGASVCLSAREPQSPEISELNFFHGAREFLRTGKAGKIGIIRLCAEDREAVSWMARMLWITGENGPRRVFGGRPSKSYTVVCFEFEPFTVVWEQAGKARESGCTFYGTEGALHLSAREGCSFSPADGGSTQNILQTHSDTSTFWSVIENNRRAAAMHALGLRSLKLGRAIDSTANMGA